MSIFFHKFPFEKSKLPFNKKRGIVKDTLRKEVSSVYKNRLIRTLKPIDSFVLNLSALSHSFVHTKIYANSVSIQSSNVRPDFIMYAFVSVGLSG